MFILVQQSSIVQDQMMWEVSGAHVHYVNIIFLGKITDFAERFFFKNV